MPYTFEIMADRPQIPLVLETNNKTKIQLSYREPKAQGHTVTKTTFLVFFGACFGKSRVLFLNGGLLLHLHPGPLAGSLPTRSHRERGTERERGGGERERDA